MFMKSRPRERLAIGAVADVERIGIDLHLEGNLAAMTTPVDLHGFPVSTVQHLSSDLSLSDHNRRCIRRQQIGYGAAPGGPSSQAAERSRPPDPPKKRNRFAF
jgi:hypothetical protein